MAHESALALPLWLQNGARPPRALFGTNGRIEDSHLAWLRTLPLCHDMGIIRARCAHPLPSSSSFSQETVTTRHRAASVGQPLDGLLPFFGKRVDGETGPGSQYSAASTMRACAAEFVAPSLAGCLQRSGCSRKYSVLSVIGWMCVHRQSAVCIKLLTLRAWRCGNGIDLSGIGTWVVKDRFAHAEPTDTQRTRSTTGKGREGPFVEPTRSSRCRRIRSASR